MSSPTAPVHEVIIQPRRGWVPIDWRELWEHRELLGFMVQRDLKVRYKQTVLGLAWAVLQPTFSVLIFSVIFGAFAKIPSDGVPYPVFAFAGMLPWMLFSTAVTAGGQSLINQQHLLTKVYMPRMFIPAASIGTAVADFAIAFVVFLLLMLAYGRIPGPSIAAVPLLVGIAVTAALGASLLLSSLTVSYRDFRFVLPFMMQVWMYLSPVIYPVSMVPEKYQWILAINPMVGVIDGFRSACLGQPWNWDTLGISAGTAVGMLAIGLFYFRRTERRFADIA